MSRASKKTPYLKSHPVRGYALQRVVPKPLVALAGRSIWQRHIGRVSPQEARLQAASFHLETERLIARLQSLDSREAHTVAGAVVYKGGKAPVVRNRKIVSPGVPGKSVMTGVDAFRSQLATMVGDGDRAGVLKLLEGLIPMLREDPDASAETQVEQLLEARSATDALASLHQGITRAQGIEKKLNAASLNDLVDLWQQINEPKTGATIEDAKRALQRFIAICGDLLPAEVTSDHVRKFRDEMLDRGHSTITVEKALNCLSTVFNVAVSEGKLTANPFYRVNRPKDKNRKVTDRRLPFSREQVVMILSRLSELRTHDALVFKLVFYCGLRPAEATQLRVVDVVTIDGLPCLKITAEGEGMTLKTLNSERTLPLHPAVVDEVCALAKARKVTGRETLFDYKLIPNKGTKSQRFSDRVGKRWLRTKLKITDKRLVPYSARHNFEDELRRAGAPEYICNQAMGHTNAKGKVNYGIGVDLKTLAEWMSRIAY